MHRIMLLLFEVVVLIVIVIFQLIARVLGCFSEVNGFTTSAASVTDDVVRVYFLHVVIVFFFSYRESV